MHGFGVDHDGFTTYQKFNKKACKFSDVGIRIGDSTKPTLALEIASVGTATASSGAATLNTQQGVVTTESLTTAQNAKYTLTLTNSKILLTSNVLVTIGNGTNSQATPVLSTVTPAAGSVVIVIANKHDTAVAFNGSLIVNFLVLNPS